MSLHHLHRVRFLAAAAAAAAAVRVFLLQPPRVPLLQ
jgi:hypothetical protein